MVPTYPYPRQKSSKAGGRFVKRRGEVLKAHDNSIHHRCELQAVPRRLEVRGCGATVIFARAQKRAERGMMSVCNDHDELEERRDDVKLRRTSVAQCDAVNTARVSLL